MNQPPPSSEQPQPTGLTGARIVAELGLAPLPDEGGHWSQTWIDGHGTGIYFLLQPDDFSAFHRLPGPELYHFYGGAPAELWQLHPDGSSECLVLGMDLAAGHRPCRVVPGGTWQGSRTTGDWTLLGCTMAPPFRFDHFEIGLRDHLLAAHPHRRDVILALTRSDSDR